MSFREIIQFPFYAVAFIGLVMFAGWFGLMNYVFGE